MHYHIVLCPLTRIFNFRHKSSRRKDNDSDRHSRRRSRDRDESSRTYSGKWLMFHVAIETRQLAVGIRSAFCRTTLVMTDQLVGDHLNFAKLLLGKKQPLNKQLLRFWGHCMMGRVREDPSGWMLRTVVRVSQYSAIRLHMQHFHRNFSSSTKRTKLIMLLKDCICVL